MSVFRFKQFSIRQEQSAFKVGTDSILLGAWANPALARQALDIGTGTGILALMLAQKTALNKTSITAIDRDEESALEASGNAQVSPWSDRITVLHRSLLEFIPGNESGFDYIISNPPYFTTTTLSEDARTANARNAQSLPFADLATGVSDLLQDQGRFCMVLPVRESMDFVEIAGKKGLKLARRCKVHSSPVERREVRHLLEFVKQEDAGDAIEETPLTIETGIRHHYTDEFKRLTGDFYFEFKN